MSQQVQELIDKIKTEGIQEAEQKAREIDVGAQKKREEIIREAEQRAQQMIGEAEEKSRKIKEATQTALAQAARDMLLNLRKQIETTLTKVITREAQNALTPEQLAGIIQQTVQGYIKQYTEVDDVTVTLSPKDLKVLKNGFMAKLKEAVKQPLHFQSADDIGTGFTISFDGGKSCFDFTDKSLVEYLSSYLNAEVSSILKSTISPK